jgi:hypothetical protein
VDRTFTRRLDSRANNKPFDLIAFPRARFGDFVGEGFDFVQGLQLDTLGWDEAEFVGKRSDIGRGQGREMRGVRVETVQVKARPMLRCGNDVLLK